MPSAAAVAAASAAAAAPRAAPPGFDAGTMVMPAIPRQPAPAPAPPPAAAPAPTSDATVVFRPARLVPQNPEAGKNTFSIALKPMAIGSETGNDIRLGSSGVDGKHVAAGCTQLVSNSDTLSSVFVLEHGKKKPVVGVPGPKALEKHDWERRPTSGVGTWALSPDGDRLAPRADAR